ncbi:MAG: hypothetical protein HZA50_00900 [Planctomycetes bacterium]|nr:hypothetical protein [Planctomycetota bacterium]
MRSLIETGPHRAESKNGRNIVLTAASSGLIRRAIPAALAGLAAVCVFTFSASSPVGLADQPATMPAKPAGDVVELELKDKLNLGVKADAGASFSPDGKTILFAALSEIKDKKDDNKENNEDAVKRFITYSSSGLDGKDGKEICKLMLNRDVSRFYSRTNFPGVFPNQRGNISQDGNLFVASLNLAPAKVLHNANGLPFQLLGMDGKNVTLPLPGGIDLNAGERDLPSAGLSVICGVFGGDGLLYCVWPNYDSGAKGRICSFDPKTNSAKVYARSHVSLNTLPVCPIAISPDRTRIAGIGANPENNVPFLWAFDIKSNEFDVSGNLDVPLGQNINPKLEDYAYAQQNVVMPQVGWSQDNSTMYATHFTGGLYSFKPFVKPAALTQQEIDKYKAIVAKLGDDDYKQRDAAEAELRAAGPMIAGIIREAMKSEDAEIAKRAQAIFAESCTKKADLVLDRKTVVGCFIEISPGYLFVKGLDSSAVLIVNAATGKSQRLTDMDGLILIDRTGSLGLFRNAKDNTLWTAKIGFKAGLASSASLARTNPGGLDNPVAIARLEKITVDGDLNEWKDVKPLPMPFMKKDAGTIKLAWTKDGLYGSASVEKKEIKVDPQQPWSADSIEIFLEKNIAFIEKNIDGAGTEEDPQNGAQYVFSPGDGEGGEGSTLVAWGGVGKPGQKDAQTLSCSWKKTEKGFDIEFCIPADMLVPAVLKEGTKMGLNFAVNKDGKPEEQFYCDKNTDKAYRRPLLWGTIILGK